MHTYSVLADAQLLFHWVGRGGGGGRERIFGCRGSGVRLLHEI